ncbi:uncharacterized protein [Clinocottus analis]|uniref:uncharacterized protein n=1 Tax=Clinocottus analis TaxID=304258 RepID=UPI0035C00F30
MKSVSPGPDYRQDMWMETSVENVTEASIDILTVLPAPHPTHKASDILNVADSEKLRETNKEPDSVSFHKNYNHDTQNNTDNVTGGPIRLSTVSFSVDQNSDSFNNSVTIIDAPIQRESSTPRPTDHSTDVTDSKKLLDTNKEAESVSFHHSNDHHDTSNKTKRENVTDRPITLLVPLSVDQNSDSFNNNRHIFDAPMQSESATPRPTDHSRDVTDTEKLLDTNMEAESISFHQGDHHDMLHYTKRENVTKGPIKLLTVPLAVDQNSDSFNNSGHVIDAPIQSESSTPRPTDHSRDVTDSEKLLDTNMEAESVLFHQDDNHGMLHDTKRENFTDRPITPLVPLSVDQNSDYFTNSAVIIDAPMQSESSTSHPTDNSRDVNDSEKLLDTNMKAESISFHLDDDHDMLNHTERENVTDRLITLLTAPLSADQNGDAFNSATEGPIQLTSSLSVDMEREAFNISENIIKTPMKSDCKIRTIKCPEKATKMQSTFGAWMSDASQLDGGRYWLADHFSGRVLVEHRNSSTFHDASNKIIDVRRYFQGCGHVVYKRSFYFHNAGSNRLIKFDLNTGETNTLIMANSRYHNLNYLFGNSKTYFKFAVDENGLWVIFAADTDDDDTMVAKINADGFSVESVINTRYPTTKAGNAFIVCGVLYFTDDNDRKVTYAFDLKKGSPVDASFDLRSHNGILAMLSYYPNRKLLYMWDNSSMKICKVKLKLTKK